MLKLRIQLFADGKVTIDTDLNEKGFSSGLDKMKSIAATGFSAVATSVGVAAVAIGGLVAKSVTMAGELEQQIGGTEAVFGELADTVQKKAAGAFDQMGLSANDFMATANKMGALMQGSGLDIETSMDLSTQAMQRAADVASIMGIDVNSAMESIAGAAKGNFTMMDNLGVAMNATTIEAYALSKGIKTAYNDMDNATKVGLAMEMFLEKTSYAAGNYAKENQTFAGSFNTLKAATSNFLSGAGGIEDVATSLTSFAGILATSIGEMAPQVIEGLVTLVETLVPQIPSLLQQLLPPILNGAISLINGLIVVFPQIITLIQENLPTFVSGALMIVQTLINTLLKMLPELLQMGITMLLELVKGIAESLPTLIPTVIDAVILMVETLIDNIDLIIDAGIQLIMGLVDGLMNAMPTLIDKMPVLIDKLVMAISNNLPKIIEMGIKLTIELAKGIIKALPDLLKAIPKIITSLVDGFKNYRSKVIDIGKDMLKGMWEGIKGMGDWLWKKVKELLSGLTDKIKNFFGIKSPSRLFKNEIGANLALGLGEGFEDEIDSVYKDMQHALDLETGKMTANVQSSGTYQMAMAGTPSFNLVDNANNTTQLVVNGKVLAEVVNTENRNREVAVA